VSDKGPRRCELLVEPICRPASGQRTVDLTLRPKRGGRLCAGYRAICLRRDQVRRAYLTGRSPEQNIKYRSPVCGKASRRGDLAPRQRRARTSNNFLFSPFRSRHPYFFVIPVFVRWNAVHDPRQAIPLLPPLTTFVHGVHRRSLFRPWYLMRMCRVLACSSLPSLVFSSHPSRQHRSD